MTGVFELSCPSTAPSSSRPMALSSVSKAEPGPAAAPYTRAEFKRLRADAGKVDRREGLLVAVVSVALGVAQIIFLRWGDAHLSHDAELRVAVPAFFLYLAIVGVLLWIYMRQRTKAAPPCPGCGARLRDASLRIASATGRCDECGGQVIA